jgi:hypothetical protein
MGSPFDKNHGTLTKSNKLADQLWNSFRASCSTLGANEQRKIAGLQKALHQARLFRRSLKLHGIWQKAFSNRLQVG